MIGPRHWRWQIGLRTTILLIFAIALGLNIVREQGTIPNLRQVVQSLRMTQSHKEFKVVDRKQVATQLEESNWSFKQDWQVYLPPGGRYRVCLATRVGSREDRPTHIQSAAIEPGQHILSYDQYKIGSDWRVTVTWNQVDRLIADETGDWLNTTGGWGWSGFVPARQSIALGTPVLMSYQKFSPSKVFPAPPTQSPSNEFPGLKLWIETEVASPGQP